MSENEQNREQAPPTEKDKKVEVKVSVDTEQMKMMMEQVRKAEEAKKLAEEEAARLKAEVQKAAEDAKKITEERDDLEGKLEMVAEKELSKRRSEIIERAKSLIKDEQRVKEIEEKLKDPEQVAATAYMLEVLQSTLEKGEEEYKKQVEEEKKKAEEEAKEGEVPPAGSAPLNEKQAGEKGNVGYDSSQAMIADLRKRERSEDPEVAAQAKAIINELFKRWATVVKGEYREVAGMKGEGEQPTLEELTRKKRD